MKIKKNRLGEVNPHGLPTFSATVPTPIPVWRKRFWLYVPSLKFSHFYLPYNKTWNFLHIIQLHLVYTLRDYNMIFWIFFPLSMINLHENYITRYLPSFPSPLSSPFLSLSSSLSRSCFEILLLLTVPLTINTPSRRTQHNLIFQLEYKEWSDLLLLHDVF